MAKTLATIQSQIQKLEAQAAALKAKEAIGVVARIKEAIDFYGLTPADLFDTPVTQAKKNKRTTKESSKDAAPKKKPTRRPVKFADDSGNTWVGHGKRPTWFVNALASGKTPEDMLVANL